MIKLPNVTLVAITGLNYQTEEHKQAIAYSCLGIEFGEVKLIQLEQIKDIDTWNHAVIYELPKYIKTEFCLLIHADGYIIHPNMWTNRWLKYSYVGAPWPLPKDNFSYRDERGGLVRVGNSVSLRSKKLMDLTAQIPEEKFWAIKERFGNTNEDGFICSHNRLYLEEQGCKFAPLQVAKYFSKEHEIEENKNIKKTFCFHKV